MGKHSMPQAIKEILAKAVLDGVEFEHFSPTYAAAADARRAFFGYVAGRKLPPFEARFLCMTSQAVSYGHAPLVVIQDPKDCTSYRLICTVAARINGRGPVQIEYGRLIDSL